jgi:hypothetical protein
MGVDVPVHIVIRFVFREIRLMVVEKMLVALLPANSRLGILRPKFLKELHQAINQPTPTSYDMESAFVLMLFQNLVQSVF